MPKEDAIQVRLITELNCNFLAKNYVKLIYWDSKDRTEHVNCKVPFQKDTDISALNRSYFELLSYTVTEKSDFPL